MGRTKDIDRGWSRIKRELKRMGGISVEVGVHADAGTSDDGTPIALYAAANEYGTERIPERSFMRSTFDESRAEVKSLGVRLVRGVEDGKLSPERAAGFLGEHYVGLVKDKILSNIPPPNKPATVQRKGSSRTLVDNGFLLNSIRWKLGRK